ncbi:universal stress protein [Melioribacteraceae bacterium 4301-Me]|uniref:universal stress protein n=1 Tax=Pyranulibacter aquaticus TaxID=3163344 RepID=UPI0035963692
MIFNKIGLAITFSPNALPLLQAAKRLQDLFNAKLFLIHVGEKTSSKEGLMSNLLFKAEIQNNYELIWQDGEPTKVILNLSFKKEIDLLIAGALEKENILKYYIGSVARNIMRESPCSVLILTGPSFGIKPFKKFCALVQYTPLGEYAISTAYEFAKLENADEFILIKEFDIPGLAITIADTGSINEAEQKRADWQKEEELKLKVFANEINLHELNVKTVCIYGKQGWASSNYVKEIGGDLLIVPSPTKKLKLFDRIFQHDLEFILQQLPCALLIIKRKE